MWALSELKWDLLPNNDIKNSEYNQLPAVFEFFKAWVNSPQSQDPLWTCKSHVIDDFILMVFIKPKFSLRADKNREGMVTKNERRPDGETDRSCNGDNN